MVGGCGHCSGLDLIIRVSSYESDCYRLVISTTLENI